MNYTNSGIPSVGSPHSKARIINELNEAIKPDNFEGHLKLLLTEEGMDVIGRFAKLMGCLPSEMPISEKARLIKEKEFQFDIFLHGIAYGITI